MQKAAPAFGIDPSYVSRSFIRSALTSDADDPESFANLLGKPAYAMLGRQFSFNADGAVVGGAAQTDEQKYALPDAYNVTVPSFTTTTAAKFNSTYYEKTIGGIASREGLIADDRLVSFIKTAYGLSPNLSKLEFRLILERNPDNPSSYAAVVGATDVVAAFAFDADGNLVDGGRAQTEDQLQGTLKAYERRYDQQRSDIVDKAASNY